MVSLTPSNRSNEVKDQAMKEGTINGAMILFPSLGILYIALQNPKFRKLTNWQSRTAMTIMPALFVFALTSELKVNHRMKEVAEDTEHSIKSVEWAERQRELQKQKTDQNNNEILELRTLYRKSILESKVYSIIPGNTLGIHHQIANTIQSNPLKVVLSFGLPAVTYIFYSRTKNKAHMPLQLKIIHTRVLGQFTIVMTLLSVMAFKEFMDSCGTFVTEGHIEERIDEMVDRRNKMLLQQEEDNERFKNMMKQ